MTIYYCSLKHLELHAAAVDSLEKVAYWNAKNGVIRIEASGGAKDIKRHNLARTFANHARDRDDQLVILDQDHIFPEDICTRLSRFPTEYGVVGALTYMRGEIPSAIVFARGEDGKVYQPVITKLENKLMQCLMVGQCAVSIRRWVFDVLFANEDWHMLWQFTYPSRERPWVGEDLYFGELCEEYNIPHWCDLSTAAPHLDLKLVGPSDLERYTKLHPELFKPVSLDMEQRVADPEDSIIFPEPETNAIYNG